MNRTVLIVDDSSIIRRSLKRLLGMTELADCRVLEAENGKQALEIVQSEPVGFVFLDINMPVMTGTEFLKNGREQGFLTDIKVVVVSTEGSDIRNDELKQLGAAAQLRKPVRPELLSETISELTKGAEA